MELTAFASRLLIFSELKLFAASFIFGALIVISYTMISLLRRAFRIGIVLEIAGELLYWGCVAVSAYYIQYRLNYGILRFFSVFGTGLGLFICHILTRPAAAELSHAVEKYRRRRMSTLRKRRCDRRNRLKYYANRVTMLFESFKKKEEKESRTDETT